MIGRRPMDPLQRFLAAPLVAAGTVAACALAAAFHGFLAAGAVPVVALLGGAALAGSFAAGLTGPRPRRPAVGLVALAAAVTTAVLLDEVAATTRMFPRMFALVCALVLLPLAAGAAALGIAARRFLAGQD